MIYIASDHGGYRLKEVLKSCLKENDIEFVDLGTNNDERTDYPIYAKKLCLEVSKSDSSKGILLCRSGHGMTVTANKFKNIRASLGFNKENIISGVEDDDLNVLTLPSDYIADSLACEISLSFIHAKFKNSDRYLERLNMVKDIEKENFK